MTVVDNFDWQKKKKKALTYYIIIKTLYISAMHT